MPRDGLDRTPKRAYPRPRHQKTVAGVVECVGVGLHSGAPVKARTLPALPGTGIVFRRTDVGDADQRIVALWDRVTCTRLCTKIANKDGVSVGTVEHLMAALAGLEIDNAVIELDGPEVPIMDGSSEPFVRRIEAVGTVEQKALRRYLKVLKPVSVTLGDASATLSPASGFSVHVGIEYESNAIRRQSVDLNVVNGAFRRELAAARTFGFLADVEKLWAAGLARGGSLENAVVINGDQVLNVEGLRFDDEFVRHKALDAVGDMYLSGGPIEGRFEGVHSGHAVNNALLRALFADHSAYAWVEQAAADRVGAGTPWPAESAEAQIAV